LALPVHEGPFPTKIVSGGYSGKGPSGGGSGSSAGSGGSSGPSGYKGAFKDRQRRADYNSWRRSGNCFALDVPNIVLWMDEELALQDDEDECLY
jgi:hypothetical protein